MSDKKLVLVVGSHETDLVVKNALGTENYEFEHVTPSSGINRISALTLPKPDLIIMDNTHHQHGEGYFIGRAKRLGIKSIAISRNSSSREQARYEGVDRIINEESTARDLSLTAHLLISEERQHSQARG